MLDENTIRNENVPKIIFIVPYRNRESEKLHFFIYMKYIMEDYDINDYEIYFSHQQDIRPFNRGATKNIGFLAVKNKYPDDYKNITFVFNDIDTLPFRKNDLDYITRLGNVKHFYGFTYTLGGIFSITGHDFEKCNGFPNNWGWGLEDNEMQKRVLNNNMVIDRSNFYTIHSKNILHLYDSPMRLVNNSEPGKFASNILYDNLSTIRNIDYVIEKNTENSSDSSPNIFIINISNFTTLVDPQKEVFYKQNIAKSNMLKSDLKKTHDRLARWSISSLIRNIN